MHFVVGSTGKVGRNVVSGLASRGLKVRALARRPDEAGLPPGVEVAPGDLSDPGSLSELAQGCESAFLVWPFLSGDGAEAVVAALAGAVPQVVYLSAQPAGERPESFWAQVERAVEGSAREWTMLRPTGFAANTLGWAGQIRESGVVRWVYGQAARSLIHERDIADVAVRALTEPGHHGRRYVLSGPAAITQIDQVHAIGAAIGRPLRWEEVPAGQVEDQLAGIPAGALKTWASFVDAPEVVTQTVAEVTGTPARSYAQWARDHAGDFAV
jgi:uncharacterized protein YbjT (DUF2867 family)